MSRLAWSVVIPCLNEVRGIADVIESVLRYHDHVIVVDDGSDDGSPDVIARYPVTLLRHAQRRGKGEALRSGFAEALRQGHAGVLTMDGDGQHLASDIPRIRAAAQARPDHLVIGARLIDRRQQPFARRWANHLADWGISWVCAQPVIDTQSGQRWYPRAALTLKDLPVEGFAFEAAILIAACRELRMDVVAVPIASRYQTNFRASHFRPSRDVMQIARSTAIQLRKYGDIIDSYRQSRRRRPLIWNDPGEA
ncbi:glycosyltransferase family 2 protein [Frateuria aurantia]